MFEVTIYEDGESFEFYNDYTKSAIDLLVEDYEKLTILTDIVLKSRHSIEIRKLDEERRIIWKTKDLLNYIEKC